MKYWGLRIFANLIMLVGFCICVPGIVFLIFASHDLDFHALAPADLIWLIVATLGALLGLPFIAFGELLHVMVAIERNTRETANFFASSTPVRDKGEIIALNL